ncbi:TolC family protein [Mailhella sp.]|uniref:TolC family protein n=1 Tax=Mailhella sp. TaxID=1981029 RepID=UPI0040640DF0
MKTLPALGLALLLLSGCAAQQYSVPSHDVLSASQTEERYAVDREWWKLYGDAQLDSLVSLALERNIDLARSAVNVNRALYRARQFGAELVPSFSAEGSASSRTYLDSGDDSRSFSASLGLNYELDLWGRIRESASAQAWEYEASALDLESARLALVNSVVNTWYSMAYTKQALEISRENLRYYKQLYGITEAKFRSGKTDGLDPAQTRQALLNQKSVVLQLEDRLADEERTLRDLLALRPEEALPSPTPDLLSVRVPSVDLGVPVVALGARPDVKAAEARLQGAFRSWEAAKKDLYPSLSIGGTLGASAASSGDWFSSPFVSGLVRLTLPFLDWNRVKWNVRISEADFEDAQLSFRQSIVTALNEVSRYYSGLENAKRQLENDEKTYAASQTVEAYRKNRYELGSDEMKDWLDALRSRNSARLSVLESRYGVISSTNAVYQALGGRLSAR